MMSVGAAIELEDPMNDGADIVGFDTFCGLRSSTFGCCSSRARGVCKAKNMTCCDGKASQRV